MFFIYPGSIICYSPFSELSGLYRIIKKPELSPANLKMFDKVLKVY
ncbi:hypothetical protein BACEGG_01947 [Bacteroides eggerthii DSM 20697]|nr:hypothetical protein BACEGG_01947 [Bacteroides eggerthii DSM 20697]